MSANPDRRLRLRTYRQVWRTEQVIYQIERVRLPFPVTFRQIGVFTAAALTMAVAGRVPPLAWVPATVRYLLIPALITWYVTNRRLDGKPPHRWLLTLLHYGAGPKRLNRLQPIRPGRRFRLIAWMGWRLRTPGSGGR